MKIALCFVISYDHILNKEDIWREWIAPNSDIINIYFYYKDFKKIKSPWILEHTIPPQFIHETTYYHVIPAYLSLMQFALTHDPTNQWICLLTDSCCPIISPDKFRSLFYQYWNKTIMRWNPAWWNITIHKRANLALFPEELRLGNDPWFIVKREHIGLILHFIRTQQAIVKTICDGGLANESLFAIILYKQLSKDVINAVTHLADWTRMSSATSPHIFTHGNAKDIQFLEDSLSKNKCAMFLRKVAPEFPNEILKKYIYQENREKKYAREPFIFMYRRMLSHIWFVLNYCLPLFCLWYGLKYIFL